MEEREQILQLLAMLITDPRAGVLMALLMAAAIIDCRTYKIPNWLTFSGAAFGLLYSIAVPFSPQQGFLWALGGFALGFAIMLPMYALKVMGAGDVKLMAMVGAFLGVHGIFQAILCTFIVGGILALGYAIFRRALGRLIVNIKDITKLALFSTMSSIRPQLQLPPGASIGKLPYGVSIGIGTTGYVLARQLGYL